jgi:hypothetical protein
MIELLLPCGFDTLEYSSVKATIDICMLADYSVAKKRQQFPHFSELMDFSRNCLPESQAMRNFNHLDFCNDISGKIARIRFIDIQNPSLRFLHRWLSFTLLLM